MIYIFFPSFLILLVFSYFSLIFRKEKENKGAVLSLIFGIVLSGFPVVIAHFVSMNIAWGILGVYFIFGFILIIPFKPTINCFEDKFERFDERKIMFSRAELKEGSERFEDYYKVNPEHKILDDKFRQKPGLLAVQTQKYHLFKFTSTHANFQLVNLYKPCIVEENIQKNAEEISAKELTNYIKKWSRVLGAIELGVTELKEHHLYSHKGRGEEYGKNIKNKHEYAIAFTVEMTKSMVDKAPEAEIVLESSQQYLKGATIAAQLSQFLRNLGYSSKPHFDGNYEVICPLVARDAGLGEIGRMGLLMTPQLGPRVRIGVVTTNAPLETNLFKQDNSLLHFCSICRKCADNCPSRAISLKNREVINGCLKWPIKHESCFTYWNTIGTDCGKCMQVCPYSHPANLMHNLIRAGIKNSKLFARLALILDDLFYGRKPKNAKYKSPL